MRPAASADLGTRRRLRVHRLIQSGAGLLASKWAHLADLVHVCISSFLVAAIGDRRTRVASTAAAKCLCAGR